MTSQDSTRTYSYHFTKINDKNNKTLAFNQDTNDFSSNFNKISFRYFAQCQQNQKRLSSPPADLSKFSNLPEKTSQPLKKYTFSLLAKQQKTFRKSENVDYVKTAALTPKYPLNANKILSNTQATTSVVDNGEQIPLEIYAKKEYKKQNPLQIQLVDLRKDKTKLQAHVEQLKAQNELFKIRLEESKKIREQQEEQLKRLNSQILLAHQKIRNLTHSLDDLESHKQLIKQQYYEMKRILQKKNMSKDNYKIESNLIKQFLLFQKTQSKEKKEQYIQTDQKKVCKQYKELIHFAGFNSDMEDYHVKMIRQIEKIGYLSEQNASFKAAFIEAQKQKSKMWHHLKNNQSQLVRLCNLNAFLNSQISKASILISNCNQEINLMNLRELERKMMMKEAFD